MKSRSLPSLPGRLAALALALPLLAGCAGGWRHGAPPTADAVAAAPAAQATSKAPQATADGVVFRYKGNASSVALAGEFNAWNTSADPLTKQSDGTWQIVKKLDAGRYAYKFVVDGGKWEPDPNAAETVDDGYGGKNSLVVVGSAAATPAAAAPAAAVKPAAGGATSAATTGGAVFVWKGGGSTVAVAGEFNAWNTSADMMTKQADGSFKLEKKLEPGRYAYKFVVDGGTWKEDPNATETVDDGYGGKNAVIVVGGAAAAPGASTPAAAAAPAGGATGAAKAPVQTADGVTFTFAGAATSVAIAGDFNAWAINADMLQRQADGSWTITKKLAPGSYAYKFVVNGSTWKSDDANPESKDDGYGGKNSIVTVK